MPLVICDYGLIEASIVPASCLGSPGFCPEGVYDTILLLNGKPVDWADHWDRFSRSCILINGYPVDSGFARQLEKQWNFDTGRLRVMAFKHPVKLSDGSESRFMAVAWTAAQGLVEAFSCKISQLRRIAGDKSYNTKLLAQGDIDNELRQARSEGYNDVLFCNSRGELCEGSYSNVWLILDGALWTPPVEAPCLPGITRNFILTAAARLGISVRIAPVFPEQITESTILFLTSSIRGIQRVSSIGDQVLDETDNPIWNLLVTSNPRVEKSNNH